MSELGRPIVERRVEQQKISFEERRKKQEAEILSNDNRWYAGLAIGHDPTPEECAWHYVNSGGAKRFAEQDPLLD